MLQELQQANKQCYLKREDFIVSIPRTKELVLTMSILIVITLETMIRKWRKRLLSFWGM